MRRRVLFDKDDNYVTALYTGSGTIMLLGEAYPQTDIKKVIIDGKDVGRVKNYSFNSGGDHRVTIYLRPGRTTAGFMFNSCTSLVDLDLSHFDMSKVTSMDGMLYNTGVSSLRFENMDWSELVSMQNFCANTISLNDVTFVNNKSPKLERMSGAFSDSNIRSCDLSGLDHSNVITMSEMFNSSRHFKTLRMMYPVDKVTDTGQMFGGVWTIGTFYYNKKYNYDKIKPFFLWSRRAV